MLTNKFIISLLLAGSTTNGFTVQPPSRSLPTTLSMASSSWDGAANSFSSSSMGSIEQIEFKIYPDGRVEETVRGVKGNNCHQVTEKINEALGKVVSSAPTEEMYEQELTTSQTIYQSNSDGGWEGSSSW